MHLLNVLTTVHDCIVSTSPLFQIICALGNSATSGRGLTALSVYTNYSSSIKKPGGIKHLERQLHQQVTETSRFSHALSSFAQEKDNGRQTLILKNTRTFYKQMFCQRVKCFYVHPMLCLHLQTNSLNGPEKSG